MKKNKKTRGSGKEYFLRVFFSICTLFSFSFYLNAQVTLTGTVVDEIDSPMFGVVVKLQGEAVGTTTDLDGKYQLTVPEKSTLEFSFVGYKTQTVLVKTQKVINIKMEEDAQLLDEVVVVGYSTIRKQSLTGALKTIDNEKLTNVTTPNAENLLAGKAPGVNVTSGSGQPGDAGKIVIRGKSTLSGSTDPLWVVDGVIVGNSGQDVNPADIETITILKDAASTAIYGSQGANGIVQVTTKQGVRGKMRVNLSAKFVATTLNKGKFEVMNSAELYDLYDSFGNKEALEKTKWWNSELRNNNYDWWKNATQTGFGQDYNLSISGGSEQIRSYVSIGMYDETGAVKGYDYTKYNLMMKVEYQPLEWLKIRPMVSGSINKIDDRQHSVSAMYGNLPWDSPYNEDGELIDFGRDYGWVNTAGTNYLYNLQWNKNKVKRHEMKAHFDFDIKLTDWLTFASVNSYGLFRRESSDYTDPRSTGARNVEGRITEISFGVERVYTNQLLRINKVFGNHVISAVAGYEWNETKTKYTNSAATGFVAGYWVQKVAAIAEKAISGRSASAMQSYLTNVNYSFDDRYIAQVSFRRDGASNFGADVRYGNFASVSGAWNIKNERFFKCKDINSLKLRVSYGSVGNRPNFLYGHYSLYGMGVDYSYNTKPGIVVYSQMGNPDLGWEKSNAFGVGVDLEIWNKVNLTLDYYRKNTSDLLYNVDIPAVTGMSKSWRNAGELRNEGFEANVDVNILRTKDITWNIDANIGINRNKITKLYGSKGETIVDDGSGIAGSAKKLWKIGKDSDTWYLREWAGVDPKEGKAMWYKTDADGARVTTTSYSEADEVEMGAYTPDFFGGFSTSISYKDFDLSTMFSYAVGGKIYNYARAEYDSDGAYTDRNQMKLQSGWSRWEKEGDIATHPKPIYNNSTNSQKPSSRFLESGTYLKMKSLSLGYNVPKKIKGVANLRITLSGENLFTISSFSGVDPEIPPRYSWTNGQATGTITGVATSVYPSTRKFSLGINITL